MRCRLVYWSLLETGPLPSRGVRGFRWRQGQHELLLPFKSHQGGSPSCCELQKQFSNPFTATLRLKLTQMGLSWPSPGPSNKVRLPLNEIFAEQRLRHFPPRPSEFFSPQLSWRFLQMHSWKHITDFQCPLHTPSKTTHLHRLKRKTRVSQDCNFKKSTQVLAVTQHQGQVPSHHLHQR